MAWNVDSRRLLKTMFSLMVCEKALDFIQEVDAANRLD